MISHYLPTYFTNLVSKYLNNLKKHFSTINTLLISSIMLANIQSYLNYKVLGNSSKPEFMLHWFIQFYLFCCISKTILILHPGFKIVLKSTDNWPFKTTHFIYCFRVVLPSKKLLLELHIS